MATIGLQTHQCGRDGLETNRAWFNVTHRVGRHRFKRVFRNMCSKHEPAVVFDWIQRTEPHEDI